MKTRFRFARVAAMAAVVPAIALSGIEFATDAAAQSVLLRRSTVGYFVGKVGDYANGRLTVMTEDGLTLKAVVNPRTKIAVLKPADLTDLEEGTYIASAGREKDSDNVEALEIRIVDQRLNGVGEGYRPFYGGLDANQVMANAKVVTVVADAAPPVVHVRIRGRDKTLLVPDAAPIMFQMTGDATALVPGAPVSVFTVRSRSGKTDVVRINVGTDGVVPQIF